MKKSIYIIVYLFCFSFVFADQVPDIEVEKDTILHHLNIRIHDLKVNNGDIYIVGETDGGAFQTDTWHVFLQKYNYEKQDWDYLDSSGYTLATWDDIRIWYNINIIEDDLYLTIEGPTMKKSTNDGLTWDTITFDDEFIAGFDELKESNGVYSFLNQNYFEDDKWLYSIVSTSDKGKTWDRYAIDNMPDTLIRDLVYSSYNIVDDSLLIFTGLMYDRDYFPPDPLTIYPYASYLVTYNYKKDYLVSLNNIPLRIFYYSHFYDRNTGVIFGVDSNNSRNRHPLMYRTEDGGETWELLFYEIDHSVTFRNTTKFIGKDDNLIINTSKELFLSNDRGKTWSRIHNDQIKNPNAHTNYNMDIDSNNDVYVRCGIPGIPPPYNTVIIRYRNPFIRVGVNEYVETEQAQNYIYPNPASDYIEVQFSDNGLQPINPSDTQITITNMLGLEVVTEVIQPTIQSHRINVSQLPRGVYFIRIGTHVEKFVKW